MTPRDYDSGKQDGFTEATLDGLAKSVDELRETLKTCFPCTNHEGRISALEVGVKIGKWLVSIVFGTGILTSIVLLIIK